ncbi:uncharacterized protein [Cicer arietinum]|uniref:Uncharacterized protein LOC101499844 n=1 Tax=Cicer arietinum TaxID=3827 RepID=A0A1S2XNX7_CICAR|nr:uncharacterized protein LOC101499844 [Cicer arietinum]
MSRSRSLFPSRSRSGNGSLPVSSDDAVAAKGGLIRRRISNPSFNINTTDVSHFLNNWSTFPRSNSSFSFSFSSMCDSARKWWAWSWAWILSRKPIFATDLEMNELEIKLLASRDRGSWKHVFYRMRSEIRKITNSHHCTPLPQTYTPQSTS